MGGPLLYSELEEIYNYYPYLKKIKNFVETGTYKGFTTLIMAKKFEKVYTVEIEEHLYNESIENFKNENISNITAFKGDSVEKLPEILKNINKDDGVVYFIDAHSTGSVKVPLMKEIDIILSNNINPCIYIFDDVRFWKGQENSAWDWDEVSVENILKKFNEKNIAIVDNYVKNDRFFILTVA